MAVSREVASYQGQQEIVDAINGFTLSGVAQKAVWFDSVSSMQRADIPAGATAATRGYYTVNDGGNAFYYIREKAVSDVEDGGSIIFLDNENVAELIADGTVNVKQFGAYGDGTHDDSSVFTLILTNAKANSTIYIPPGTYLVDSDISIIQSNIRLCGAGENTSIIKGSGYITIDGHNNEIDGISFVNFGGLINNKYTNVFSNCRFSHCDKALTMNSSFLCRIINCIIEYNNVAIIFNNESYETVVTDSMIDNNKVGVIVCGSTSGLYIINTSIEGNRDSTGSNRGCGILISNVSCGVTLRDCWFESNGSTNDSVDILVYSTGHGNVFDSLISEIETVTGLTLTGSDNYGQIVVDGCNLNFTKHGIFVDGCYYTNVIFANNKLRGVLDRYNQAVTVYNSSVSNYLNSKIECKNNKLMNTSNSTIDSQMLQGIKHSYIYALTSLSAAQYLEAIKNNTITLDGEPIYLYTANIADFTNVIYCGAFISGHTPYTAGYMDDANGYHEMKAFNGVTGSKYVTNAQTSSTNVFGTTGAKKFIVVAPSYSKFKFQVDNNGVAQTVEGNSSPENYCLIYNAELYSAWMLQSDNNMPVCAVIMLTDDEYNAMAGCRYIKLRDFHYSIISVS